MKPSILLAISLFFFASCEHVTPPSATTSTQTAPTTRRVEPKIVSGPRKGPRVIRTVPDTGFREIVAKPEVSLTARTATGSGSASFTGTARKAAKISIAPASTETFNIAQLITWCETHDGDMRHHTPPISSAANSGRLPEEDRNVSVNAWVHYAKRESDHDYHLIVGSSANLSSAKLMNVEISGLPPRSSRSFTALKAARDAFEETFGPLAGSGYTQFEPIQVHMTGSLFYDIDHAAGVVGPSGHRPKSAWEIHPITAFEIASE